MKKLLIASTALVATSGFAYADVTLGGSAQFGIIYIEDRADPSAPAEGPGSDDTEELFLDYELQFDFSASGETDGGLGFGMSAELESDSDAEGNQNAQGIDPEIFITSGFGTLTVGALDTAPDQAGFGNTRDPGYDGVGVDNLIDAILFLDAEALFNADEGGRSNIMYQGSFGGLSLTATAHAHEQDFGIVAEYDFGAFRAGLSYMEVDEVEIGGDLGGGDTIGVTVGGTFAGFDLDFVYADHSNDFDVDAEAYGLSGAYDLGAYGITFGVNQVEIGDVDGTTYGIGVEYDLGGGAELQAGVASLWDPEDDDNFTTASFGIAMSF
ncbi:porin [Dinoroseobacter sp. PD6]|uniref:porin n=1 Tax=Dinoroseobacter sp. PD6 TaxID=3028384 RepID=UPI00237A54FF|nr:porin [Dinoroseobacter sp. PD6]MDD9717188.1 porin [Dinoroseobacter sp. PD6]